MTWLTRKTLKKFLLRIILPGFILFNLVTFAHAWRFTHFTSDSPRTAKPDELSFAQKIGVLFTGVSIPKPKNEIPEDPFDEIWIPTRNDQKMNAWIFKADSLKGVVLLYHGYAGHKGSLVPEALAFRAMGYEAILVDFLGHGDSPGHTTSLGYGEAIDVKSSIEYVSEKYPNQPVYLFGFSMGAAAVIKALSDYSLPVEGAIIGAPFSTMLSTVENRFSIIGVPSFPFAEGLLFWGGIQQRFWAFAHNPESYAKKVKTPILVMHGDEDERATLEEASKVFNHLNGPKKMKVFKGLGHQSYYLAKPEIWEEEIKNFLYSKPL